MMDDTTASAYRGGGAAAAASADPGGRRAFLRWGLGLALLQGQGPRLGGEGENGTLGDPTVVGRSRTPTVAADNDAQIKQIEQKLACTCGCTLDIFTCRTTDFSCTYSPALHREVVALHQSGLTAQQVIDTFVARYGEKALMAPKPEGFGLAGYLVPAATIAAVGGALAWVIGRRQTLATSPATGVTGPPAISATPEELERLRRALTETNG